jgi:hypothetical protein
MVESRHNELTAALNDGFAKGVIKNKDDMEMYLATAKRRHDQEGAHTTPYECLTGQKPANIMNMALVNNTAEIPEAMKADEKAFSTTLREITTDLMEVDLWRRDDLARTNARRRHQQLGKTAKHTHFDIKEGDEVSFQGKLYRMGKTTGASENKPITATISDKNGKERKVQYKDLKPAATPRPGHFFTREMPAEGAFIIWEEETELQTGIITSTNSVTGEIIAHQHQATQETSMYWLPLWKGPEGKITRAKAAPANSTAANASIKASQIRLEGELTLTHAMTGATKKEALARSLI